MPTRSFESAHLISEKILQHYVFEQLNTYTHGRRKVLPPKLRAKAVKVVIPEYPLYDPNHRADFRIIFKDQTTQNVEVEWTTSRFRHGKDVASTHYGKGNGFVATLENDREGAADYAKELEVVEIDPYEFSWWFNKRAKSILDSTIATHVSTYQFRDRKYWVIYVGKKGGAESDYLERGRPNGLWAFGYPTPKSFANIISIMRGDVVVFTTKWKVPQGRRIEPGLPWSCSHIDVFEVTKGYYCDFKDGTFENEDWAHQSENKEYMHYFRFNNVPRKEMLHKAASTKSLVGTDFSKKDENDVEIRSALKASNTRAGAPVNISVSALANLCQRLEQFEPVMYATPQRKRLTKHQA